MMQDGDYRPMALHLIKLSVGPESLTDLAHWQQHRLQEMARRGHAPELMHVTRQMPKRAEELLAGGSIYWVIKGWLCARQTLLELRPLAIDGVPHCGLVLGHELIRVRPRQHRPFQGWRYLAGNDAPPDLTGTTSTDDVLERELAALGLL